MGSLLVALFMGVLFYFIASRFYGVFQKEAEVESGLRKTVNEEYQNEAFVYDDAKTSEENLEIKSKIFVKNCEAKEKLIKESMPERSLGANYFLYIWIPLALLGILSMAER